MQDSSTLTETALYNEAELLVVRSCYAAVFRIQMTFGVLAFLTLVYMIHFIVFVELRARGTARTLKTVATPGNLLIVSFFFFLTGLQTTAAWWNSNVEEKLPLLICSLMMAATLTCYGWYSYLRGHQVLRLQMSERYYKICKMNVYFLPIASFSPPISMMLPITGTASTIVFVTAASISGFVTITLDSMFCYSYLRQILNLQKTNIQVPREYQVIAKYGLIAAVTAVFILISFTMGFVPVAMGWIKTVPLVIFYSVSCTLFSLFMSVMGLSLALMKVALVSPISFGKRSAGKAAKFLENHDSASGRVSTRLMGSKQSSVVVS
ncbi:hypothetical protein HDU77_004278 [Chytriomyces hyalinus]|nr:hypothetical protein HDU77_004278 [Chytriomyces hyalinus]